MFRILIILSLLIFSFAGGFFISKKQYQFTRECSLGNVSTKEDDCYIRTFELKEEIVNVKSLCDTKIKDTYRLLILLNKIDVLEQRSASAFNDVADLFVIMSNIEFLLDIRESYKLKINNQLDKNYSTVDDLILSLEKLSPVSNRMNIDPKLFLLFMKNSQQDRIVLQCIELLKERKVDNLQKVLEQLDKYITTDDKKRKIVDKVKLTLQLFIDIESLKKDIFDKVIELV